MGLNKDAITQANIGRVTPLPIRGRVGPVMGLKANVYALRSMSELICPRGCRGTWALPEWGIGFGKGSWLLFLELMIRLQLKPLFVPRDFSVE